MRNGGSHPEIQIGLPVFPIGNTKYSTERNTDTTSNVPNTKHSLGGVPDRNTNTVQTEIQNPNTKHSLGGVQGRNTNTLQTEIQNRTRNTYWEVFTISKIQ